MSVATLLQGSFRSSQAGPVQLLREIGEPEHDLSLKTEAVAWRSTRDFKEKEA